MRPSVHLFQFKLSIEMSIVIGTVTLSATFQMTLKQKLSFTAASQFPRPNPLSPGQALTCAIGVAEKRNDLPHSDDLTPDLYPFRAR